MQEKRAQSSASVIAGFSMEDWYGKKTWSGFGTSTWLIQQKFAMWIVGNSRKFLKAEEKRMLLFSHFLYYSSAQHFSELLGSKSFSFGRCDKVLKSKPWKKAKKWSCSELIWNRSTGKSSVIRSQRHERHSNPTSYEEDIQFWIFSISVKKGQNLTLGKNIFLLKKGYSTEYSRNISWNIPQNILWNILLVAN